MLQKVILLFAIVALLAQGFKIQDDAPNDDQGNIVFAIQMTRHGARSPYLYIDEPIVYLQDWKKGLLSTGKCWLY